MSILRKQRKHLEAVKLGRVENYEETTARGCEHLQRRLDSSKAMALTTQEEFPVGRKRHVVKPGSE